ncbi:MAG: hypothetical protein ACI4R9_04565 [Kiritimatiellia bacterium]
MEAKRLAVLPVFADARFMAMAAAKCITEDEALADLFEKMMAGGKLDLLKNCRQIVPYLQIYVKKYIRSFYAAKEDRIVPLAELSSLIDDDGVDGETAVVRIPGDESVLPHGRSVPDDEKQLIQRSFHKLWKKNPIRAYVLMFRMKENISSKTIMKLCHLASENYVNKTLERAKRDMTELLKETL